MRSSERRTRRPGPRPLPRGVIVALAVASLLAWWLTRGTTGPVDGTVPATAEREARPVRGTVVAAGEPVPGARVTLYEDAPEGFRASAVSGADGGFEIAYHPRAVFSFSSVFVRAETDDPAWAPGIAPASDGRVELVPWVEPEGRVVDAEGRAVEGATVLLAVRHAGEGVAQPAPSGRFRPGPLPRGAPLDVAVARRGSAIAIESRFRAGDPLLLRVHPGHDVTLTVVDPDGNPVAGARGRPRLPRGLQALAPHGRADDAGRLTVPDASDGDSALVEVTADGFLPAHAPIAPHEELRLVLWPAREVEVVTVDAQDGSGVEPVRIEHEILPAGDPDAWTGGMPGRVRRPAPHRPGERSGAHLVDVPRCRVQLRITSPHHEDATVDLAPGVRRVGVRLRALRRTVSATLALRAPDAPDGFPVVVADEEGGWATLARLRGGAADVAVPPDRPLQVISPQAWAGSWLPLTGAEPTPAGRRRELALGLREAERLVVEVEPPVPGTVELTDLAQERLAPAQRHRLEEGRAVVWLRPLRSARLKVFPEGNWFEHEGEILPGQHAGTWTVRLRAAAGVRLAARDRAGNAVPFAVGRLWEPGRGGRLDLWSAPRIVLADARGTWTAGGLVAGQAALEIRKPGLRSWRSPVLVLETGDTLDRGVVELGPPGRIEGRVVAPDGSPAGGVSVRMLEPDIRRLTLPNGASVDRYDLQAFGAGTAYADPDGRFVVSDRTPRAGLLAVYPGERRDAAPMAVAAPGDGAPIRLRPLAYVELDAPESVRGVYRILEDGRAVLVKNDPPISLRPLPVVLPAGAVSLFVRLRDGRWGAANLELAPGETRPLSPTWHRD